MSVSDIDSPDSDKLEYSNRFQQVIWHAVEVCRNCYRRRATVYERNFHNDLTTDGDDIRAVRTQTDRNTLPEYYSSEVHTSPHESPTRGVTGCCECGAVSRTTIDRPVDRNEVLLLAARAVWWFRRAGYVVERQAVMARVADQVRKPERQHEQDEIIDTAIQNEISQ